MENHSKLMTPLFVGGMFNSEGRRMWADFEKEITDGTTTYKLWRSAGKPNVEYPRAENDRYYFHAEVNGRLLPLGMTEWFLIDRCGFDAAVLKLYSGKEARQQYFNRLRDSGNEAGIKTALATERTEIELCGSDPACQTQYIRKLLDGHVSAYLASNADGGKSFPDFIGALIMDDLARCSELSAVYKSLRAKEREEFVAREAAKAKEYADSENEKLEQTVSDAVQIIKSGGILDNKKVVYYETPNCGKSCSLINYLMRRYNVKVPLRTQGWIETRLTGVRIENGESKELWYRRTKNGRGSQLFFQCMNDLIHTVTA